MSGTIQKITPFLWFDHQAEEAAEYYTAIFRNSRIGSVTRYDAESAAVSGMAEGTVMTVTFQLEGQEFVALNGGPQFTFTEAISFVVNCESQSEVDHYWGRLTQGGDEQAQQCGWLKDKFGVSWQIVPTVLVELLSGPDPQASRRVTKAMLQMKKIEIDVLERAAEGRD